MPVMIRIITELLYEVIPLGKRMRHFETVQLIGTHYEVMYLKYLKFIVTRITEETNFRNIPQ